MPPHVLVLNHNGRDLLAECLPSVLAAAERSSRPCEVVVIDNSSSDDSVEFLRATFPETRIIERTNQGLCSFNSVLEELPGDVAVLLNNDVKLAPDAIDPLIAPLAEEAQANRKPGDEIPCYLTASLCYRFDGKEYEGQRTALRWRWGLLQATSHFPGAEKGYLQPGWTASAGAAIAVDRKAFLRLGGFDPVYLPGRIEDLDFAFRLYQAGGVARHVPQSVAYHRGQTTFARSFGRAGCDLMATRNTLLFQWKNLRSAGSIVRQAVGIPLRLALDPIRALWAPRERRFLFTRAFLAAWRLAGKWRAPDRRPDSRARERQWFRTFGFRKMSRVDSGDAKGHEEVQAEERTRAAKYPISRWVLRPLAGRLAARLAPTTVRPWHVTLLGLLLASCAAAIVLFQPSHSIAAAGLILGAWFLDRTDGQLARRQGAASRQGAWLDANIDELVDLTIHGAMAASLGFEGAATWPWIWFMLFVCGKYLLMYGLHFEDTLPCPAPEPGPLEIEGPSSSVTQSPPAGWANGRSVARALYHAPANADIRVHVLAFALATGFYSWELACFAVYYNLRWLARFLWVPRRLARSSWEARPT